LGEDERGAKTERRTECEKNCDWSFSLAWRVRLAKGIHREAHVKTCPECNGDGVIEKGTDDEQQCPTCGGSGFVPDKDDDDEEVTRTTSW
jgi:DnaJ-class molecular chaperone